MLDRIEMQLRNKENNLITVFIDVCDNSLARKWITALNNILRNNLVLEKNFCFLGFADSARNVDYLTKQINWSIESINAANLGYYIDDVFTPDNTRQLSTMPSSLIAEKQGLDINHGKMNMLHRYFEDLQGSSGNMSQYYENADAVTKWHIRQLNLLCHEYESLVLSMRKQLEAPAWQRPSQLMCWLNAPRFSLDDEDFDLFGIDRIAKNLGEVTLGVNKAVGKHHWEVFTDEGRDSRIDELTTTALSGQTEAAGDFDIEWANNPGEYPWMVKQFAEFREWLSANGFDPDDKYLTIGHPKVGQIDLNASFGTTTDYQKIWNIITEYQDVYSIKTSEQKQTFDYRWSDLNFIQMQINEIAK